MKNLLENLLVITDDQTILASVKGKGTDGGQWFKNTQLLLNTI
jgi:hypothetical protein